MMEAMVAAFSFFGIGNMALLSGIFMRLGGIQQVLEHHDGRLTKLEG